MQTFTAFGGLNGAGKTHAMVNKVIQEFPAFAKKNKNAKILSNIKIFNTKFNEKIKKYNHITDILYCTDAFVVIDEIQDEVDNRDFWNTSKMVIKFFEQHRHSNLRIYCTTQAFRKVDIKIRELIQRAYRITKKAGVEKEFCFYQIEKLSIPQLKNPDIEKIRRTNFLPMFGLARPSKTYYNTWEDSSLTPYEIYLSYDGTKKKNNKKIFIKNKK